MRHLIITLALIGLLAPVTGCNQQDIAELRLYATELKVQLATGRADLELTREDRVELALAIADMPEGKHKAIATEILKDTDAALEKFTAVVLKIEGAAQAMDERLESATDGFDVAEATVESVAPLLPAPWGAILLASGTLAIGLIRAGYNRTQARKIVRSIDGFGKLTLTDAEKVEVRLAQGAGAGRIVDEAQGKKTALPF